MYGLNSRAGHLAGIFENNDQTYSVENSRPFIPTKETHANDDHHGHAEHNPDVYHFEVNGPQDHFQPSNFGFKGDFVRGHLHGCTARVHCLSKVSKTAFPPFIAIVLDMSEKSINQ
ncbi:hypothetical protein DI09_63p20 [Mitosporidium daphniae]|uniref:Uncharacterized protein n=1 Tax=Mitosporidium daphniae TaxID=1485682 RepID=A0A098VNE6_9MICR|nr:uncharacterized protein DI09_63p20 [Mitosporidium daphniae]KGG50578.1 hypothetical protein DI09_63p20 [Mitosporidium daphniae]|eukprot:XP_013237025.1 uncharacterized protein DI09_63p20 [Mitosporidium daphniae]